MLDIGSGESILCLNKLTLYKMDETKNTYVPYPYYIALAASEQRVFFLQAS